MSAEEEAHDPAEDNSYLEGFSRPDDDAVDPDDYDFDELSDENRQRVMNGQPPRDETNEATESVDHVSEPADLDWEAFAQRYGFDQAAEGDQPRHTSRTSLVLAFEVEPRVGSAEEFLERAVDDSSVPLVADDTPYDRFRFAKEVLRA